MKLRMRSDTRFWLGAFAAAALLVARGARGDDTWVPLGALRGVDNDVEALFRLNSGPIVVGGEFTNAGAVRANFIALYNGTNWFSLANGFTSSVYALAGDGTTNNIYAGGDFGLRRWNGSAWVNLGTNLFTRVQAISYAATNDILIGGAFTNNGLSRVARWNGTSWVALGSGLGGTVRSIARGFGSSVVAGGIFTNAGAVPAKSVALWDGTDWFALGQGLEAIGGQPSVSRVAIDGFGVIYAAGDFQYSGPTTNFPVNRIARWTGSAWQQIGSSGLGGEVRALQVVSSNNMYAGGTFANYVARWNGTSWATLGSGMNYFVNDLFLEGLSVLHAGGVFWDAGGRAVSHVATWNGATWTNLGQGFRSYNEARITAATSDGTTHYVAVHNSQYISPAGAQTDLWRWDGAQWWALGPGFLGTVHALALNATGQLFAAGSFTNIGGVGVTNVARWNGTAWTNAGPGLNSTVRALLPDGVGGMMAGGEFLSSGGGPALNRIALWNGANWASMGAGFNDAVRVLARDAGGIVYAGGSFAASGPSTNRLIAQWNGSAWTNVGSGLSGASVYGLAADWEGGLYVLGGFTNAGGVAATNLARWSGSGWASLAPAVSGVTNIAVDGQGRLIATGSFTNLGGVSATNIAAWNGSWAPLGEGLSGAGVDLFSLPSGDVLVGGAFARAGGLTTPFVALLKSGAIFLTAIERSGASNVLRWSPVSAGYLYGVYYNTNLISGGWTLLLETPSDVATDSVHTAQGALHYRVEERAAP